MAYRFEEIAFRRHTAPGGDSGALLGQVARLFVSALEPLPAYDDEPAPVDRTAVLESLFRRSVIGLFDPPTGLTWPNIDGVAGLAWPQGALFLWTYCLSSAATAASSTQRDRDVAVIGLALAYVVRDLRGLGHSWLAGGLEPGDFVSRKDGQSRPLKPPRRRGLYAQSADGGGGDLSAGPDLRRALEGAWSSETTGIDARRLARAALDGLGILDTVGFGKRAARCLNSALSGRRGTVDDADRALVKHGADVSPNEFGVDDSGRYFTLAGNVLGWFRGRPALKVWRRVTLTGPEGRLLASLLKPGAVPVRERCEVVSHLRKALKGTAVVLLGSGSGLQLRPPGALSTKAKHALKEAR